MTAVQKRNSAAIQPAEQQPVQLELFRLVSDDAYSNAFDFYESIPRFIVARWATHTLSWNADGTAAPVRREFTYKGKRYRLTLAPAYVDRDDGTCRAEFPGVKEEVLELVLTKLAMDKGYFTDGGDGRPSSDSFVLFTTMYQIAEELKRRGRAWAKSKSYSYEQIREGLEVLAKSKMHLTSEDGDDIVFSPIADFGYFNDKARSAAKTRDAAQEAKSARGATGNAAKATVYIRFNALISQAILSRGWRQINYERIIGADLYLARWLRKMLGLRFTYAAPSKTFNINLSTLIENSGVTLCQRLSDNLKQVEQALQAMPDVVARYHIDKEWTVHAETGRGRVLADAKIIIRPTETFTIEQIKSNVHESRIDDAVITDDGRVMLEPDRKQIPGFVEFEKAKSKFQGGRKIKA